MPNVELHGVDPERAYFIKSELKRRLDLDGHELDDVVVTIVQSQALCLLDDVPAPFGRVYATGLGKALDDDYGGAVDSIINVLTNNGLDAEVMELAGFHLKAKSGWTG